MSSQRNVQPAVPTTLSKDQRYHEKHRQERLAVSQDYYQRVLKQRRQQQARSRRENDEDLVPHTIEDVAEDVSTLESDVEEWKNVWGTRDWRTVREVVSEADLQAHHAEGIVLRRRLKHIVTSESLDNKEGQLRALYWRMFDLNTALVQGLVALNWFGVAA
ncbi:hypothetical protein C8J56DRAFT_1062425 [Mycena floridula]|nr:hypothetical protein C8J56DRAFT_1062425 [Mycena floridula]